MYGASGSYYVKIITKIREEKSHKGFSKELAKSRIAKMARNKFNNEPVILVTSPNTCFLFQSVRLIIFNTKFGK